MTTGGLRYGRGSSRGADAVARLEAVVVRCCVSSGPSGAVRCLGKVGRRHPATLLTMSLWLTTTSHATRDSDGPS